MVPWFCCLFLDKLTLFTRDWLWSLGRKSTFSCSHFSRTIPPSARIWTLVTGGFIESNVLMVETVETKLKLKILVDLVVLLTASELFEPVWGATEFLVVWLLLVSYTQKFVLVTTFISCTLTSGTFIGLYVLSFNLSFLYVLQLALFTRIPLVSW